MAAAALVAVVVAPAAASALLTNEWNQQFAGTAVCVDCHGASYDQTSHGQFVKTTTATIEPSEASGMYDGLALGGEIDPNLVFTTGAGTGLREYLVFGKGTPANGRFGVAAAEWDPSEPSLWEMDGAAADIEFEDYACNQCHMLGATKKGITPPIPGAVAGTANAWAKIASDDPALLASWIPGASIQCERCHGTGVAAASTAGGHWNSGVQIVGFNTAAMKSTAKAASTNILKSEVCGQCHGSFKSGTGAGNIAGYTPDRNINEFVKSPYLLSDVPTTFSTSSKFFPNGENKGNKHSYYTEWALSAHSVRGFYSHTATDPVTGAALTTPFQQDPDLSHYSSAGSSRLLCNRCHTGEGYLKRKGATIMSGWTEGVDTAGKLGQECATCHISHGNVGATGTTANGEAVGMAVRPAETAMGNYSTFGLSVDNKSICEDCHNWQKELTNPGQAVALPSTILGKYVSHPQREIYHGRAMLEIPAAKDFMPGAKCEQCHMPATKSDFPTKTDLSRYADRSWKRYSHRMFIMMPGDAKAWGLAPWGDSCSPCHAGETQDELQANVDSWQETAADLAAEATGAITAAQTRGDAVDAGDIDLLKRASANVSLFAQDGSGGAHNPPYEQAGLSKAIELAKSAGGTLSVSAPAKVGSNALFGIAGMAMNGDGTHAAGVTVKLYKGTTLAGTAVSDDMGNYAFAQAQTVGSTYTVKWARSSQAVSDLSASATVAMIVPQVETDLSLKISRSSARRSITSYTLSGVLEGGPAGAPIALSYKRPGSSTWTSWVTVTTSSTGAFSKTTRGYALGYYTYRAKFVTTPTHLGSSAQARILIVR